MSTSETLTLIPMYKARVQELCRQKRWPPPVYTVERDGPDHAPRFSASVTVNGVIFYALALSKSSREAKRKAAQVAVDHFAVTLPPQHPDVISPPKPSPQNPEARIPYKAQLQIYAQKNTFELPKYDAVCQGYPHVLRFMASVTVDGQTFNSEQFFSSLKEAENDAAKEALLSLSLDESREDKSYLYKSMLQELAMKEGISLPKHETTSNGASHMPIFSSTVEALLSSSLYESRQYKSYLYKNMLQELAIKEGISLPEYKTTSNGATDVPIFSSIVEIGGSSFMGDVAKSKKQAEMNAAKVAWFKLKEYIYLEDGLPIENVSSTISMAPTHQDDQTTCSSKEIMLNGNGHIYGSDHHKLIIKDTLSKDETSTSFESASNGNGSVDVKPKFP